MPPNHTILNKLALLTLYYILIWKKIRNIPGLKKRIYPKGSEITADALIIFVKNTIKAKKCRKELLKVGISTKILPEAYSWHFAGLWSHIKEFNNKKLKRSLKKSENLLRKAVSIPIFVKMKKKQISSIYKGISKALK